MYPFSYVEREKLAVTRLGEQMKQRTLPFKEPNAKEEPGDERANEQ